MRRVIRRLADQEGSALVFTTVILAFLLIMGGIAIDLAYLGAAKGELQRSMDAAALAGAGKLGFNSSVFPTVRLWAQQYATKNPYRNPSGGTINLALNTSNDPNGNIVLGIWQTGSLTPSLNGAQVNAVRCQYQTQIPTSFLRLLGFNTLPVRATATAIANPPAAVGCGESVLPIAVTSCSFYDAGTGAFTNTGCGAGLTYISSNTLCDNSPGSPQSCNTAAWVTLDGSTPNAPNLTNQIQNAANPGACYVTAESGDTTQANNGMIQSVFNVLVDAFQAERLTPLPGGDIVGATGQVIYPASGGGWETGVMMVQTACPPGPISGDQQVLTYAKFVITQMYDNKKCVVDPNPDPQAAAYCGTSDPSFRAVFGYFRCDKLGTVATLNPAPLAALAPHLRLVQ